MVRWVRRLVRAEWRAEQTSNSYELLAPAAFDCCDGRAGRETRLKVTLSPHPAVRWDAMEARAALAAVRDRRRAVVEGLLLG
jgi:hypothetical protein